MPSEFSMTFGVLPSMTATHELVVPRSIPMTLPMVFPLQLRQAGRAAWRPSGNVSGSSADPDPAPLIRDSPHFRGLLAHIGGPPGPASQLVTKTRGERGTAQSMVIRPLPHRFSPVRQALGPSL